MEHIILNSVLVLLVLSFGAILLFRRLHLPPILGYLIVGAIVGPHALGWLPEHAAIKVMAEVGLAFLLFSIGLEFSIPKFLSMRRTVLGLGGAQVVFSTIAGGLVAWGSGLEWKGALVAGGAMALSSTAIVIRQLSEQLELHSRHGRNALGVLLFQDIAAVPFLIAIPILASGEGQSLAMPLLLALTKGALVFFVLFAIGHWALRPLFDSIAATRSSELFMLTVLVVSLAAAWVTQAFGLSLALGAFMAGMMLGETEYRHQVEIVIQPFRDILMGLFFISVGTALDLTVLPGIMQWVFYMVLGLVLGKGLLIVLLTRMSGSEIGVALRTGLVLAQGGEFGFALLAVAVFHGLLVADDVQAIIAALVFSMALAPIIVRYNGALTKYLFARSYTENRRKQARDLESAVEELTDHIVLCGFGRIGQNLATFLRAEGFNYVALDLDPGIIREASTAGENVFYGDATHVDILKAAGLERAKAVVVSCTSVLSTEKIIYAIRSIDQQIPVIARTVDDTHLEALEQAGATEIIPEAVESSMMLAASLLQRLDVPIAEVMALVEGARANHYRNLRSFFHGSELESFAEIAQYRLHSVVLLVDSYAIGRTIESLELDLIGVSVFAVRRGAVRGDSPLPGMELQLGDVVVLQGAPEELEYAEARLLQG